LGAVTPSWDPKVPAPSSPYTTRFILSQLTSSTKNISIDADIVNAFFVEEVQRSSSPSADAMDVEQPTEASNTPIVVDFDNVSPVLGILATQGLKELKLTWKGVEHTYALGLPSTKLVAVQHTSKSIKDASASSTTDSIKWNLYSVEFTPPSPMMQALCQARLKNILAAQRGANGVIPQSIEAIWSKVGQKISS